MQARAAAARGGLGEIVEETDMEEEEKVYVAVAKEAKEGKSIVAWLLQNTSENWTIVLLHIHRPSQRVPTAMGWIPPSQMEEQEVAAYRRIERENIHQSLDEYVELCNSRAKKAEKLVIEKEDVAKGLMELIASHGITKLVMGAAAEKNYKRKMTAPRSKTALAVRRHAHPSCKIWFVCKGHLICTREASVDGSFAAQSSRASPTSNSSKHEIHRSISSPTAQSIAPAKHDRVTQRSFSDNPVPHRDVTMATWPNKELARISTACSRRRGEQNGFFLNNADGGR